MARTSNSDIQNEPVKSDCAPGMPCSVGYDSEEYKQNRLSLIASIRRSTVYAAVTRNSNLILQALVTTAVAAIVMGAVHVGEWGIAALVGGVIAVNIVGAVASYRDERMSRTTNLNFNEARQTAEARMNAIYTAQEMAEAMDQTIGKELRETNTEARESRKMVEEMRQDMKNWQEKIQHITQATERQLH